MIVIGRLRSKVEFEDGVEEKWHDLGSDRGIQHAEDLLPSVLEEEAAVDEQERGRVRSAGTDLDQSRKRTQTSFAWGSRSTTPVSRANAHGDAVNQ